MKNFYKFREVDAAIKETDIYYRDIKEAQKSSQTIEDQKLHLQEIYSFDNEKNFFEEKQCLTK